MVSSTTTPVWGPQLPRIPRHRVYRWSKSQHTLETQSRNGITKVETTWNPTNPRIHLCVSDCKDTYRNPKFEPFRQSNFYDDGGELAIRKGWWEFESTGNYCITPWRYNARVRYGHVTSLAGSHDGQACNALYPPVADLDVSAYHAKAFAKAKPTNPLIDLGVAIAELKDTIGLWKDLVEPLKRLDDWFLSLEFGWKPLLADIQDGIKTAVRLDDQFRWLVRNNGKPVRRRVKLLDESTSGTLKDNNGIGSMRNTASDWGRPQISDAWRTTLTWDKHVKVWASGEFIFWLADLSPPDLERYLKFSLLGLRLTPSVIWNATPWSWLLDWCTNVGDVLDVLSEQVAERTVARYLYVMQHTSRLYTWHDTDGYYSATTRHYYDTKVREKVHPFGLSFGADLSTRQFAILAALGSSRF